MTERFKHAGKINTTFYYTPAASTDITKSIKRERERQAAIAEKQKAAEAEAAVKVRRMK